MVSKSLEKKRKKRKEEKKAIKHSWFFCFIIVTQISVSVAKTTIETKKENLKQSKKGEK